jgi:hypothetical protein
LEVILLSGPVGADIIKKVVLFFGRFFCKEVVSRLDWAALCHIWFSRRDQRHPFFKASFEHLVGRSIQCGSIILDVLRGSIALRHPSGSIGERLVLQIFLLFEFANQVLGWVERDGVVELVWCLVCLVLVQRYRWKGVCTVVLGHELEGVGVGSGEAKFGVVVVVGPIHLMRHSPGEGHCAKVLGGRGRLVRQGVLGGFGRGRLLCGLGRRGRRIVCVCVCQPVVAGAVIREPSTGLSTSCIRLCCRVLCDTVLLRGTRDGVLWRTPGQVGDRVWHHGRMP